MQAVAREQEDRTWHRPDYMCWKVALQAFGRSTALQTRVSREGRAVCLYKSALALRSTGNGLTVLAHSLAVSSSELWPQFTDALVQLLYLRLPQDGAWRLVL
jgi:hypothetical protein